MKRLDRVPTVEEALEALLDYKGSTSYWWFQEAGSTYPLIVEIGISIRKVEDKNERCVWIDSPTIFGFETRETADFSDIPVVFVGPIEPPYDLLTNERRTSLPRDS